MARFDLISFFLITVEGRHIQTLKKSLPFPMKSTYIRSYVQFVRYLKIMGNTQTNLTILITGTNCTVLYNFCPGFVSKEDAKFYSEHVLVFLSKNV